SPLALRPAAGVSARRFLLRTRPLGPLFCNEFLQHARGDFTNRRLLDRLFDIVAHELSRVERGRAGTLRRQDITDDVEGDRPDHAGTVVELGCARYDPIERV